MSYQRNSAEQALVQDDDLGLIEDVAAAREPQQELSAEPPWRVLVVDDDAAVHYVSEIFFRKYRFRDRPVRMLSAHSAAEALELLRHDREIALVLLDVVMESDTAGLDLVQAIREDLGNPLLRIVLRTGQPGQAPPREIVSRYDIDGYCAKTDLTFERLFLTVTTALRTFGFVSALDTQRRELAESLAQRDALEAELRQAQKLEAVGRLASGVAHEINTPVQFVGDSCHFIQSATEDLRALVTEQESVLEALCRAEIDAGQARARMAAAREEADLDYLDENLQPAIERSMEGLGRISSIVRSLKEFAHPDSRERVASDLNRAVQSTLIVARNEYKYVADVETQFGDLPAVRCVLGDINQAVLNLVVNAAHAIADANQGGETRGRITVRTWAEDGMACIAVSDTGPGIPEEIRERIFEPFFTTKEVGRGTGQGLAITHTVVERHGGVLQLDTQLGRGTTFTIRLPLDPA